MVSVEKSPDFLSEIFASEMLFPVLN